MKKKRSGLVRQMKMLASSIAVIFTIAGCGGGGSGSGETCSVAQQTGCDAGLVCAVISTGGTGCFESMVVKGKVIRLADQAPIANARVVALDVNGSPVSTVATTDAAGAYEMTVYLTRLDSGAPAGDDFTLRADAAGFETFPAGLRQPLPIDSGAAVDDGTRFVVESQLTTIGLLDLPAGSGTGVIKGKATLPDGVSGVLVVAESSPTEGFSAMTDRTGDYKIFNVPDGSYTVKGYAKGANFTPASAAVTAGTEVTADLAASSDATATFNGSVQIVNPGSGSATSVILVVESTFDPVLIRGEQPPGLRVPDGGIAPNVTGAFTLSGIPTGTYVVLAAFENDFLVRDPDTCIAGTDILHQAFTSGQTVDLASGFKITGSLDVISPGADGPETVTTTTPTFTWKDDSSEENYRLSVFDTFGNKVWETTIPGTSGTNPSVVYNADGTGAGTATALQSGMYYQFRAVSTKTPGGSPTPCEISQTEDLKGVFVVQ